jgi:RNA polymerase sigma-70 factor, ECF subfamily
MPPEAEEFSAHRDHLVAVAYRMLGSRSDAEDAVQEAWLRLVATRRDEIVDLRAWLTTVTARICLDVLRSARVRREAYVGPWLPEPVVTRLPDSADDDPAELAVRADEVSLALLVVLERLTPDQRVAFILHDVFAVPFDEIAAVLGGTPEAARQLASRARRALADGGPRHRADRSEQRRVLDAFMAAARHGDVEALVAVLAPDVVAIGDGGGALPAGRAPVVGAVQVARFMAGLFRRAAQGVGVLETVLVNGDLGFLVEGEVPGLGKARLVMGFAIADGRITGIFDVLNPDKLARVPPADPARNLWPATGSEPRPANG